MSYQITQWDYGFAVRTIAGMVGHPVPNDPAGSPDPAVIQMGLAVNNALGELLAMRDWQDLTVRGAIPIVADYAGQQEKGFDLPVDFFRFIDETQWSGDSFLPAPGPVPPQGWMVAIIQSIVPAMQLCWQVRGDQLFILSPPWPDPVNYEFFYLSRGQVIDADNPTLLKNLATKNGDKFKLDGYLVTLLGRVKYLEWKGFDASAAMRDFQIVLNERAGADKAARSHLLHKRSGLPLIGACNIAGPLGGGGGGSVDLSNYYTKPEADALFLTQSETDALYLTQAQGDARYLTAASADALFLTPAEGDARYLTQAVADTLYEPDLGVPASNGQVLSSTTAGVRSWITPAGGGGTVDAASVTNTPAGNIAATNVQAALNELDSEKAATAHTHAASAITNTPAGNIAATTVQAAVNELDTEKEPTLGNPLTSGMVLVSTSAGLRSWSARTAANVINTPAGNIAATDVQAALNELDTEKEAALGNPASSGMVLSSTTGGARSWISPPGGGLVLLANVVPIVGLNLDALNVFTDTYDDYLMIADRLAHGGNVQASDYIALRFGIAGTPDASAVYGHAPTESTSQVAFNQTVMGGSADLQNANTYGWTVVAHLIGMRATFGPKLVIGRAWWADSVTPTFKLRGWNGVWMNEASKASGVRLLFNAGNNFVAQGRLRIYGIPRT